MRSVLRSRVLIVYFVVFQAAIGSKALDLAREEGDETLIKFGLEVLTLAVLAILTTAPIGALGIGLAGPRLLSRQVKGQWSRSKKLVRSGRIVLSKQNVLTAMLLY